MPDIAAYYSVIQYCPDRYRAESVNVGVFLFCADPHFVGARMASSNKRVRKLFGPASISNIRLDAMKTALEHRLNHSADDFRTLDDVTNFVATRGNDLRLTPPRLAKVPTPAEGLQQLFAELVEPDASTVAGATIQYETLPPELANVLHRLTVSGKVRRLEHIVVPILQRKLDVPYAYQNGTLNLIKPEVFPTGKRAENVAMRLAVEGDLIHRHPGGEQPRQLIIVSAGDDPAAAAAAENQIEPLFREYGVRLVRRCQAGQFAREVEEQAH